MRCLNCHFGAFKVHLQSCQTPGMKHVPNSEGIELRCLRKTNAKKQGFANNSLVAWRFFKLCSRPYNWRFTLRVSDGRLTSAMCRCYQTIPGVAKAATAPPVTAGGKRTTGSQKVWYVFLTSCSCGGGIVMVHSLKISCQAEVEPFSIRYCIFWTILMFIHPKEPGLVSDCQTIWWHQWNRPERT